ncbi:hypothetical protein FIV42_07625 [Persicimonas caeni]|uniref:Transporter n=1 Tax=Persicimonas caeni TaxID=2292766 RepID=A0A4Y6PS42_PERCE|nr:hypothetical protein [Persicimonas caeni]QDG50605.1 hypothetical protein FIV42_07625 [Persicimonas caeni]QED31826.1 hypothetical protein FRD00_07620 [Persicimonas caeni]
MRSFSPAARTVLLTASLLLASLSFAATAAAQEKVPEKAPTPEVVEEKPDKEGNHLHVHSAFALRAIPIGTQLALDAGYHIKLFDSESLLLKNTYVELGAATNSSPSNFWGGAYVEAVPLAVLKLRLQAQSLHYFGTFGYLHYPDDPTNPDWSTDVIGGDPGEGNPASGLLLDATAQLQAKVGNVVAMVPFKYRYIDMDVEQDYYESTFDFLLAPTDQMWMIQPMLAYVFTFDDSWLLTGLRWEHAETIETDLSRDMPTLLGMWKLPGMLAGGEMKLVGLGGYWFSHPNREGTIYLASQFAVDWKY